MNPVSWTQKRGFLITKLTYENYISIYKEKTDDESSINIGKKYGIDRCKINYIYSLINKHGFDVLRKGKNRYYSKEEKEKIKRTVSCKLQVTIL